MNLRSSSKLAPLALSLACISLTSCKAISMSSIEYINSKERSSAGLPFSDAVRVGDTIYLSGQLGVAPGTLKLVPGGIQAEARQTMQNIKSTLESKGLAMSNIVKCTVMLADMSEWGAFNEVYRTFFEQPFPARSAFGATGLALNARAEVECIAVIKR